MLLGSPRWAIPRSTQPPVCEPGVCAGDTERGGTEAPPLWMEVGLCFLTESRAPRPFWTVSRVGSAAAVARLVLRSGLASLSAGIMPTSCFHQATMLSQPFFVGHV